MRLVKGKSKAQMKKGEKRDYSTEKMYNAKPASKKQRAKRNADRAKAVKKGIVSVKKDSPGRSGTDIHHPAGKGRGKATPLSSHKNRSIK